MLLMIVSDMDEYGMICILIIILFLLMIISVYQNTCFTFNSLIFSVFKKLIIIRHCESTSLPDVEDFEPVTFMGTAQLDLLILYRLVCWLMPFVERWDGTSDHNFSTKRRIVLRI